MDPQKYTDYFDQRIPLPEQPVRHLDHVVKQVELDDRLALDDVIQDGRVDVAHGVAAAGEDEALEQVDDLGRREMPVVAGVDEADQDEGGAEEEEEQGRDDPEREEGVDEEERVEAVEEPVRHELLHFSARFLLAIAD